MIPTAVLLNPQDLFAELREVLRDELEQAAISTPDPWLTIDEAAEYLGLTPGAVNALVQRKKLVCHRSNTNRRRIRRSDADRYQTGGDPTA